MAITRSCVFVVGNWVRDDNWVYMLKDGRRMKNRVRSCAVSLNGWGRRRTKV